MYDKIFTLTDRWGNVFNCVNNQITLQLKSEPHRNPRKIGGFITVNGFVIYKKYDVESQIFRATNSWSIPIHIFENVDGIWFFSNKYNYKILTRDVKNHIHYLTFLKAGNEGKIYIPLDNWIRSEI